MNKISHFSCGYFHIEDPRCKRWERDFSKSYPDCCMANICVEYNKELIDPKDGDNNEIVSESKDE